MGDGVHATVSVEQPITVQDQSSQTTYHPKNGEKACPCCQFYGVPCRQVRATKDEATTRRNQRLFSSTKRKMSHQEQLAEDSLFLDSPSVEELKTIQKRKDPKCSRDTQVENQALHDYVDGLTITMNVIQPRGRKESKEQATKIMQDEMISSQGGQPSNAIHHHRMCYKCGQKGHYAKSCPAPQAPRQAGQQGRPAQPRAPRQGKVNHVTAESAAEASNVVIGTFMVNSYPAMVLFDTGATHSFISKSFAEQHGIPVSCMRTAMVVTSPGGQIRTCSICSRVSIVIKGVEFRTGLIVIDSSGIDVILGMETLTRWGVRIDCAQRTVHLSASDGQEVTVSASEPSGFLHQMEARPTNGIRMVSEFSDVFSDELPGMPPDCDIEFSIVLLPGIAPIAKHP